ncbi:MAG: InlB B-repeat-containing protein [Clostridiales bacterium]|nr:InlB B-repeat-containing protein [Clostridiales bacterium]
MKTKAKTGLLLVLALIIAAVIAVLCTQVKTNGAFAEEVSAEHTENGYIVSTNIENIAATFGFTVLNETECSVRITNKVVATKAIIPSYAEIDGKKYMVTEVANNGFMSSPKLIRVSLPRSVTKIGNNAFSNCAKLNRINLANVQEIGNSAFYKCPELTNIVIPESVQKIGTYILRNNNTQVRVRAEASGEDWAASWNNSNANQNVEYNSNYIQPIELEPVYEATARSANAIVGYSIASGQPRNEDFYVTITDADWDEKTDSFRGSIFIPAEYDQKPIMNIANGAFDGVSFNQMIVEYSEEVLTISNGAFSGTIGESIVINRPVRFYDENDEQESNSIFLFSSVQAIVLPNSITRIVESMFAGCDILTNIFFIDPVNIDFDNTDLDSYLDANDKKELDDYLIEKASGALDEDYEKKVTRIRELCIIEKLIKDGNEGVVNIPGDSNIKSIGAFAFQGTPMISELYLYDTIEEVEAYILEDWIYDDYPHTVHVYNNSRITGWNAEWNSGYAVSYENEFYTITFYPNGGKFVNSDEKSIKIDVIYGSTIGDIFEDVEVEKEDSDFLRWLDQDGVEYTSKKTYNIKDDIELFADWKPKTYTITLNHQGGEGGDVEVKVAKGDILPKVTAPIRVGYTFKGYYELRQSEGEGTRYYYEDMGSIYKWQGDQDITVYAHWTPKTYTIVLHSEDGNNQEITMTQDYGAILPDYLSAPTRLGYTFQGYYDEKNGDGKQYYNRNMNKKDQDNDEDKDVVWDKAMDSHLYAYWEANEYTVYLHNGYDDDETPTPIKVRYEMPMPSVQRPDRLGYTFKGYYDKKNGGGNQYYDENMNKDKNEDEDVVWDKAHDGDLYAHRIVNEYTIVLHSEDGNNQETIIDNHQYGTSLPHNLSAPERLGYTFNGYYDEKNGGGNQYYDENMNKDKNEDEDVVWDKAHDGDLYAYWTPIKYYIEYKIANMRKLPENYYNPNPIEYTIEDVEINPLIIQRLNTNGYTINWDIEEISVKSIGNRTINGVLTLNEYTIKYDLNGGSGRGDNPDTYNVENARELNDATHETKYFDGWAYNGRKITSLKGLFENLTLVATWSDIKTIHITRAVPEITITDRMVSIIMDVAFTKSCIINIASSVEMVGINGNGNSYNMSIVIANRESHFGLYLHNIGIFAPAGKYAILMSSSATLYLYHTATVFIKGHSPTKGNGGVAIACYNLVLDTRAYSQHSLIIQGGNGSNGVDGTNGTHGGHGGVGIIAQNIIIGCDFVTITGGKAGNGGNSLGQGYKGYGGYGAYPVVGIDGKATVYTNSSFIYVRLGTTPNGSDGSGKDLPNGRPLEYEGPDPSINPDPSPLPNPDPGPVPYPDPIINPDLPIIYPPIGGIIPTTGLYNPLAADV